MAPPRTRAGAARRGGAPRAGARRALTVDADNPAVADAAIAAATVRRNTVFALLGQITTGVFTTVLTLYLGRTLGPNGYGVFALALSVGVVVGLAAELGIPHSVARFLAESRGDRGAVVALLADALRLKLATAAVVTGALFAAAGPIAAVYNQPALAWPLRGIAVSLFCESVLTLYATSFVALGRVAVNLRLVFFESLVETAASIGLVAAGAGAAGAAFGRAIGYVVGAALALVVVARVLGARAVSPFSHGGGRTRGIVQYALPLFVTNAAYTLYAQVDVIIIGALLGTTAVGLFSAPLRLSVPLAYLGQSLANSVSPRQAKGGKAGTAALQTSLRWLIVFQALLLAPVVVWPDPIVRLLLGSHYARAGEVLRVLALFIFLDGLSRLVSTTVNYLGRAARRIPIVLAALAVNTAIDLALLPWIGVVGAAIGTGVAYTLYVPAHFRICVRELDLDVRSLAATLLRALAAAAAMALVLLAVGTGTLSPAQWVVGAVGGVAAFGAALVVTGEVTPADLRRAARLAAR